MMERYTARNPKNNMAYLVKVKPNEQDVESPYPNTLKAIMESFNRLAEYEDIGTVEEFARLKSADVVEVVRCKECKQFYCLSAVDRMFYCRYHKGLKVVQAVENDSFCSYGERRDKDATE